jgi:ribosomal-protein-alanine N-acetyltransferase
VLAADDLLALLEAAENDAAHVPVAIIAGEPVGFGLTTWVLDEASLLDIVVCPDYRHRGIGRQLLGATRNRLRALGMARWLLEVRASNAAALALYRDFGFRQDGVRPDYYPRRGALPAEPAILMSLTLE